MADLRAALHLDLVDRLSRPLRTAVDDVLDTQRRLGSGADRLDDAMTRASRGVDTAASSIGRDADRAGDALLDLGRDADRASDVVDRATGEMTRGMRAAGRAADQVGDAGAAAGRQTRAGTGMMAGAWRALDIADDIGGVLGMVQGLTAGLVEMGRQAIEASRQFEDSMAHLASIDLGMDAVQEEAITAWADQFALRQGGVLPQSEALASMSMQGPAEMVGAMTSAMSAGITDQADAMAAVELAAGLASLRDAGGIETTLGALTTMMVASDPAEALVPQLVGYADQLAAMQRQFAIPALADAIEAIESSAQLVPALGLTVPEWMAYVGTMSRVGAGSEAGEALNTILESLPAGMSELGLTLPETETGQIDLTAALQSLRAYRLSRPDISDAMWPQFLAASGFGELGSAAASFVGGPAWQEYRDGLEVLQRAEGALLDRGQSISQSRTTKARQVEVAQEVSRRSAGDVVADTDAATLDWRHTQMAVRARGWQNLDAAQDLGYLGQMRAELIGLSQLINSWLGTARESHLHYGPAADAGSAIPETLATGVQGGAEVLDAATGRVLQDSVATQLPRSDAERGPLSHLTAAGSAIPATLALGVLQGAPALSAAVEASLALPLMPTLPPLWAEVLAGDPDLPHVQMPVELLAGEAPPPALPTLQPLWAEVLTGDLAPPTLPPLWAEVLTGDLAPPASPTLQPPGADPPLPAGAAPRPRGQGDPGTRAPLASRTEADLLLALQAVAAELRALRAEVRDSRTTADRRRPERVVAGAGEWLAGDYDAGEWLAGLDGGP